MQHERDQSKRKQEENGAVHARHGTVERSDEHRQGAHQREDQESLRRLCRQRMHERRHADPKREKEDRRADDGPEADRRLPVRGGHDPDRKVLEVDAAEQVCEHERRNAEAYRQPEHALGELFRTLDHQPDARAERGETHE